MKPNARCANGGRQGISLLSDPPSTYHGKRRTPSAKILQSRRPSRGRQKELTQSKWLALDRGTVLGYPTFTDCGERSPDGSIKRGACMSQTPMASPARLTSGAGEANRGEVQLHGLWLRLLQALWLVLVLIDLATLIVSLPGYYHSLFTLCPGPVTSSPVTGPLHVHTLPTLLHAGFSLHVYAFYVIFLYALTTLSFLLIGALIIWRRANTWLRLFVSFLLIDFGSLGLSFAHTGGFPNDPSNPLLNMLNIALFILTILYYPCLSFFFSTFPDGRFVPRW